MVNNSAKSYLSAMLVAAAISIPAAASATPASGELEVVADQARAVLVKASAGDALQNYPPNVDNSNRNPSSFKQWSQWDQWNNWDQFSKYNDIF